MATRSNAAFIVVSSPTIPSMPSCRRGCSATHCLCRYSRKAGPDSHEWTLGQRMLEISATKVLTSHPDGNAHPAVRDPDIARPSSPSADGHGRGMRDQRFQASLLRPPCTHAHAFKTSFASSSDPVYEGDQRAEAGHLSTSEFVLGCMGRPGRRTFRQAGFVPGQAANMRPLVSCWRIRTAASSRPRVSVEPNGTECRPCQSCMNAKRSA